MRIRTILILLIGLAILCLPVSASACPLVNGFVDMNCDQQLRLTFIGDSIVYGVRDASANGPGYPGRTHVRYPTATVLNLGIPGISSGRLFSTLKNRFATSPTSHIVRRSRNADIYTIAVGTNDFLTNDPALTVRNITRIVDFLKIKLKALDGTAPLIVVATLTPNVRASTGNKKFSEDVNALLLQRKNNTTLPVYLRFDQMQIRDLDDDGLHPDTKGYNFMGKMFSDFFMKKAQQLCRQLRADTDLDGVYDFFERNKFGTDPLLPDSDSDGYTDGEEIFHLLTDPLNYSSQPN